VVATEPRAQEISATRRVRGVLGKGRRCDRVPESLEGVCWIEQPRCLAVDALVLAFIAKLSHFTQTGPRRRPLECSGRGLTRSRSERCTYAPPRRSGLGMRTRPTRCAERTACSAEHPKGQVRRFSSPGSAHRGQRDRKWERGRRGGSGAGGAGGAGSVRTRAERLGVAGTQ
jgi:hypothetical protein